MIKYYTRACNFYYGKISKDLVKKRTLPLNGNQLISFDTIELITRKKEIFKHQRHSKTSFEFKKILKDLKQITKIKRFKKIKFKNYPLLMGILNATPDSFSDGGKYLKSKFANKQILKLKERGC